MYQDTVKQFLITLFAQTFQMDLLDKVDQLSPAWSDFLEYTLQVPENRIAEVYVRALQMRTAAKKSAKFSMEDMVAAWADIQQAEAQDKLNHTSSCPLCNGTRKYRRYDMAKSRDIEEDCQCQGK